MLDLFVFITYNGCMMNDEKGTEMLNFITKQEYSGNNADILFAASEEFESPYFLTYRQAISIGKVVKKGEHGYRLCRVVFVEDLKKKKKVAKPKYFTVFNIDQTEELKKEAA